ncbi:MAG: copper homeostasis protein CutC, partial [Erysipelotrichaceae bacterium]|nr:copper homeostasis protein CutC [Erysipelotrichaceae bacterium]
MIVEICCGSYEDCLRAERGGAKRVELNSALFLGGLTPSIATVKKVLENTSLEVIAMVRPRGAGFCYLDSEVEVMMQDA